MPTEATALVDYCRGMCGPVHVALEEGTQAQWLHDLLAPVVAEVVVCDRRGQGAHGSKADHSDAAQLAELLRQGALFPLRNPALITIPLSFLIAIVVSLVTSNAGEQAGYSRVEREMHTGEFRELARVNGVGLGAGLPDELHLVGMGDEDAVAEGRELAFQPVPVERRLERDGQRLRQRAQPSAQRVEAWLEPPVLSEHRARVVECTGRDVPLMNIESDGDHESSRA